MSTEYDMLGQVIESLKGLTDESLALVKDFAHKLTGSDASLWVAGAKKFLRTEKYQLIATAETVATVYLRHLFTFSFGASYGKDTHATAKKVFKAGFDADFQNWGVIFSGIVPQTGIVVEELVHDGKFPNSTQFRGREIVLCTKSSSQ